MKRKLKLTALSLVAVMLTGTMTACSSSENTVDKSSTATPAASASTSATKDPFEIVMAMPVFGAIPKDMQAVQDEISKITKAKINATVKILPISIGAWAQQVNLMTSSGEKLDLFFEFGQGYGPDVAAGKIIALDSLLDKYGQDTKKQFEPEYLNSTKVSGKIYGIPNIKDFTTAESGVLMRKDLVDKYKIDVASIKKIDDLDAVYKTIKDNEPNLAALGSGLSVPSDQYLWYDKLGDKYGVLPGYDNGLKVENLYETKEYEDYLKKMSSWFKAGFINKDAATSQVPTNDLMKAGKIFSYFITNKPGALVDEIRTSGKELVFVPLITKAYATTSDVLTGLWTISTNSKNPERSMMFMNLMYSDKDIANLLLWGVEGKHYVKASENTIDYPTGIDAKTVGYANQGWLTGNSLLAYLYKSSPSDKNKIIIDNNKNAIKSKALGFSFNSEPVKNEITALNNVTDQYKKGLESGTLDPADKLQEFRTKLKAAGIDKVVAEKQKQLDAWAAESKK
ncbi:ABC transporter substrate-binding protein [Paenibacillus pectinilyticus]|uniref:ABC transporter substrate-binding protein n=1 Tax=Paenibacillus pectinilyticus TaxID=512399 RepID=A0A1C0ZXK4_9BACL|nr:ABC transporter substrate-binding protein [Paenibacillus pectinilyticus]OCT12827.1 ABC transporter substrate-binding protein [Paenibacillus pectinilyticus]